MRILPEVLRVACHTATLRLWRCRRLVGGLVGWVHDLKATGQPSGGGCKREPSFEFQVCCPLCAPPSLHEHQFGA